jgi:hypothetical protein
VNGEANRIRFAQVETGTACNYRCVYCPVSILPRRGGVIGDRLLERIASVLELVSPLEQLYLNGYDEPTLNPHLGRMARTLARHADETVILTNGTWLTSALYAATVCDENRVTFDVHISTSNRLRAKEIHGVDLVDRVRSNLRAIASEHTDSRSRIRVGIQIAPTADAQAEIEGMRNWLDLDLAIDAYVYNDRAGLLNVGLTGETRGRLIGCGLQNRPNEWIHINATGHVVLCCQDYREEYVISDVNAQTPNEVLAALSDSRYRRWANGEGDPPSDFICHRCAHAVMDDRRER